MDDNATSTADTPTTDSFDNFTNTHDGDHAFMAIITTSERPSRRVAIYGLPLSVNAAQLLKGIRGYGGIVDVSTLRLGTSKCALIEFVYARSASDYVSFVSVHGLEYADNVGVLHPIKAHLVNTASSRLSQRICAMLYHEQSRRITLQEFPEHAIWFALSALGLPYINFVEFDEQDETLSIEFISLFHADRAMRQIRCFGFGFYQVGDDMEANFEADSGQLPSSTLVDVAPIQYIELDFLERRWNTFPYNSLWPSINLPIMAAQALRPRVEIHAPLPTWEESYAEANGIDISEVDDHLEDSEKYSGTVYKIIGSQSATIRSRGSAGFGLSVQDYRKLHMAANLHDPEFSDEFDNYFKMNNLVNVRKYEAYGMLAEHRRKHARELGIPEAVVPGRFYCSECNNIFEAPVPDFIKAWCERRVPVVEGS